MKKVTSSHRFENIKKTILTLIIGAFFITNSFAQVFDALTNPLISVKLTHPPGLGLKINKVVFNSSTGNCSDQIVDVLISNFIANDVEVIDRANLGKILAEQNLNLSGYLDKNSAISIGKLIGPSAMITVKVTRCQAEIKDNLVVDEKKYDSKTKKYYTTKLFIARTTVYLKGSIQTTDLTTGRIFSAKVFEYAPFKENKSDKGKPDAPDAIIMQDFAFDLLANDVHKMFFSWSEQANLYFMNDKKGGLKEAYNALKDGNIDQAFQLSKNNLELCKKSPDLKGKILGHAYYNMGMMYFILNDYDKAIEFFQESQIIRPGSIVTESIKNCELAKSLAQEMQMIDDNAAFEIEKVRNDSKQEQLTANANSLTNADIISLTEMKMPTSIIIQKIKTSICKFDTSTEQLIKLTKAGVADEVVILMMEKK